jgi:hypothetical protein
MFVILVIPAVKLAQVLKIQIVLFVKMGSLWMVDIVFLLVMLKMDSTRVIMARVSLAIHLV